MFDKNLSMLKKLGYDEKYVNGQIFEIEKTKDGFDTIKYVKEEKKIYINSIYNTKKEIEVLLSDIDFDRDNLFIVYGLGMGYHIEEIYNRMTRNSYIIVIEKDKDIVTTFMHNRDFSELMNNNTLFFFGDDEDIIERFYSSILRINIMGSSVNSTNVILNFYKKIYSMDYIFYMNKEIIDVIKHAFFLIGNDVKDTIDGFENYIKNIKELIKSPKLQTVKDKYIKKPAIIVSAGPSLDKNIHLLKEAEGKALILATDAVLSTLAKYNIVPDAVFTVERIWKTYEAFYKDKNINQDIVFVAPTVVRQEILRKLSRNKKLLFLKEGEGPSNWVTDNIIKENRYLLTGSSCAHTAFSFSKYVGADPIIFVGQDLAYTKDGITHGSNVEIRGKKDAKNNYTWVKGIYGEKLPTTWVLKNFLVWFEKEILKDESGREYIDCTEGGAYKRGTKIMKLEEALIKYCYEDIIRLKDLVPEPNTVDEKYLNSVIALKSLKKDINNLMKKCKKHNRKLIRFLDKDFNDDDEFKLDNIDQGLKLINSNYIVEQTIFKNDLFIGLFQPLLATAVTEVRKLSCNITPEVVTDNMKIQINMNKNIILGCRKMLVVICKLIDRIVKDEDYINLCTNKGGM